MFTQGGAGVNIPVVPISQIGLSLAISTKVAVFIRFYGFIYKSCQIYVFFYVFYALLCVFMNKYPNSNLQAPIFEGAPVPSKIGIPLRLYAPYILNCHAAGVSVTEIYSELVAIGYLQKYPTFAQFVREKVLKKTAKKYSTKLKKPTVPEQDSNQPKVNLDDLMAQPSAITALIKRKNAT
jgi:hypothetical protein